MTATLDTLMDGGPERVAAAGLERLAPYRAAGRAAFAGAGWPTRKTEAWKYTDLKPVRDAAFGPAAPVDAPGPDRAPTLLDGHALAARLVFVDGRFSAALSHAAGLPNGVTVRDLTRVLAEDGAAMAEHFDPAALPAHLPMLALNAALLDGGYVIRVPRGVVLERPVEIVHVSGATGAAVATHPRGVVILEDGAAADMIVHHTGPGGSGLTNAAMTIRLGAGARLRHYRLQAAPAQAFVLETMCATLDRDATYETFGLATGARLSRCEMHVGLQGAGAACRMGGAYLMRGRQHRDITTVIEHAAPHTTCREVFQGVLDDHARGVFQGRIIVNREAPKTDARQVSKTLLLSDGAEIDAKPELKIYADDVKCSHGATAGELDAQALFYLRSRGLGEDRARALLIEAFLTEAFAEITHPDVAEAMIAAARGGMTERLEMAA